jgi:HKD family nuclease
VVNEAILRQRELEEKQDFYRICLSFQSKEDIKYLLSIIDNIKNKQLLYKLIWSEYLQKPFGELLKRLFAGKDPRCVIYKITNLKTGEIYIGKTKAEVSKRWTEHIKTSLNIGTVARSKIHDALFSNWDNFSFEVLERVEDETQLSSREKFYISFY